MRQATAGEVRLTKRIGAPRERVFQAWTSSGDLARWCAPGGMTVALAELDARVGGKYRIHMRGPDGELHRVGGEYIEVAPPERLVFTWQWEAGAEQAEFISTVTITLREVDGGTELTLVHAPFPSEDVRRRHDAGWESIIEKLATNITQGRK